MSKLVVFPRKSNNRVKKGDASAAETSAAVQLVGDVQPIKQPKPVAQLVSLAEAKEAAGAGAYRSLRQERTNQRLAGKRAKKAAEVAAKGAPAADDAAPAAAAE